MAGGRLGQIAVSAKFAAAALTAAPPERRSMLAAQLGRANQSRIRVYGTDGRLIIDSWRTTGETYRLRDPATEPFRKHAARLLDRAIDAVASAASPPPFEEPAVDQRDAWPEARQAMATDRKSTRLNSSH